MYSFLEAPLFDAIDDDHGSHAQHRAQEPVPSAGGHRQLTSASAFGRRAGAGAGGAGVGASPGSEGKLLYGGSGSNGADPQSPPGPIACRDGEALSAMESMIKSQQHAEKRLQTMESKILGVLDQMAASMQQQQQRPTQGLSSVSMAVVVVVVVGALFFLFLFQQKRRAPMEFVMRSAVAGAPAPSAPLLFVPPTSVGNLGAPLTFLT